MKPREPLPQPTIRVWDVKSGQPVGQPVTAPSEPRSVRFLPNRGEVAILWAGGQVLLLDPDRPRVERTMTQRVSNFVSSALIVQGAVLDEPSPSGWYSGGNGVLARAVQGNNRRRNLHTHRFENTASPV